MSIKRVERGWAGHFICAERCLFRRNTLLYGKDNIPAIVISTVGAMRHLDKPGIDTVGAFGRYYETMAFKAVKKGPYYEADVSEQLSFDSSWSICAETQKELPEAVDNIANDMHETVCAELAKRFEAA